MSTHSMMPALLAFAPSLEKRYSHALSVYLPVRAEGFDARRFDLVIGHVLSRYRERLSDKEREVIEREIPRVRARIDVVRPAGSPALAAFADEEAGLLELIRLPAETETRLEVGPLLLAPIERLLEQFPPALIAVVDKEEARVFGSVLGEVFPLEHLVGKDVKRHKAGGSSALSNQRKADNRARANLTQFVSTIEHEMRVGSYHGIYVAGPPAARAELERLLPTELKRAIAGRLSASLDSAHLQHELRNQIQRAAAAV
jgi:hypothetical protein